MNPPMSLSPLRSQWLSLLDRVVRPPLSALAAGRLKATMPIESTASRESREPFTHLEALGRTLSGLAPWLELDPVPAGERELQTTLRLLARQSIANAVNPSSPDALNFNQGQQPVVDAAFLCLALLRAPRQLWANLDSPSKERLVAALRSSRVITPGFNNWLLFSALVEVALLRFSGSADFMRIDYAVRQIDEWYKGDGLYGDGPDLHCDYYNSFVIQPMLLEILEGVGSNAAVSDSLLPAVRTRALRYAAILERMIAPDGSYPAVGRSLAYRCGAFHHLATMALRHELPGGLSPSQARGALNAVITRTLTAPDTFDPDGWLRVGLCGHQPHIGETYISTGSLYLCTNAFLPLGLAPEDPFWSDPDSPFTGQRAWGGVDLPTDHALPLPGTKG